jgi:DNA polymerase-3 subunit delta'
MPLSVHIDFALSCARKIMCFSGDGCGTCPACRAWTKTEHPDLLLFGAPGEPPGIKDCRTLWEELSLKPIASRKRVAVIHSAHRLSLPAANSLLKITEETPSTGALVLLLEEDVLIPTLRSRLRIFKFREGDRPNCEGQPVPSGVFEFMKWIGKTRKVDPKVLAVEIQDWVEHFLSRKDPSRASDLDTVRLLTEKGKLTTPMVQDLVLASLEGEVRFEELLGDNW